MHVLFRRHSGFALAETLVAMSVVAVLLAIAAPSLRSAGDRVAVAGARDATATLITRARAEAPGRRGAHVEVDLVAARVRLVAGRPGAPGKTLATIDLARRFGVAVQSGSATSARVTLPFDAYGIGRVASRSLRFRRGGAEASLTVSSYGRVRRW